MKKLVLTFVLAVCSICALQAQNIQSSIMSYLRNEGYAASYDSDGDIQFKLEGNIYYVIVKELDEGYAYVEVRAPFEVDSSFNELLSMANELNRGKYICKCSAYQDDAGTNVMQIGMEFVASTSSQAQYQMGHALRLMPLWIETFEEML